MKRKKKKEKRDLRVKHETYKSFFAFPELQKINLCILITKSGVAIL